MAYQFIEYQTSDGIGRVRLNRPEKLNALSRELQDELVDCMERADDDPDVRVMTLRGNGRAFCAGYDITPPATPEAQATVQAQRDNIRADIHRMKRTPNTMNSILNLSKPVIVGVHGYCIAGGTDLAMHCDIVIAAETDAIAHQAPIVKEFNRMAQEEGLKAALDWRDGPFRDYRGSE